MRLKYSIPLKKNQSTSTIIITHIYKINKHIISNHLSYLVRRHVVFFSMDGHRALPGTATWGAAASMPLAAFFTASAKATCPVSITWRNPAVQGVDNLWKTMVGSKLLGEHQMSI